MNRNDWQDRLRNGMENYSEPVPENLWESVSTGVRKVKLRRRRRGRMLGYTMASAFACAMLALVLLRPSASADLAPDSSLLAENSAAESVPDASSMRDNSPASADFSGLGGSDASGASSVPDAHSQTSGLPSSASSAPAVSGDSGSVNSSVSSPASSSTGGSSVVAGTEFSGAASAENEHDSSVYPSVREAGPDSSAEPYVAEAVSLDDGADGSDAALQAEETYGTSLDYDFDMLLAREASGEWTGYSEEKHRRNSPRLALGLNASNILSNASSTAGYGGVFGSSVVRSSLDVNQIDSYSAILLNNNSQEVSTSKSYYQPVSVGVVASMDFGKFFAVESGVNYTCLVSETSSGTAASRYDIRQTLHYVGVPLKFRISFWRPLGFDLYTSLGGELQKCVGGKSMTTYIVDSSPADSFSEKVYDKHLQWSAGAALGVAYRFNGFFGIFVEPGLNYYFDNGSFVETIYRESPLNFNLALGLRFYL